MILLPSFFLSIFNTKTLHLSLVVKIFIVLYHSSSEEKVKIYYILKYIKTYLKVVISFSTLSKAFPFSTDGIASTLKRPS